jgi:hypothetical protein
MPTRLPLPKLSFRWQITLLGVVVIVLFIATLIASLAALQYTKSAVLNNEKRRLFEAASTLARNLTDQAKSESQAHKLSSVDFSLVSSPEVASEVSQATLQRIDGVGGGFYRSNGDLLLGYSPATGAAGRPLPAPNTAASEVKTAILKTARIAAQTLTPSEEVLSDGNDILLIEAVPIHNENSNWGSAWSIEQLQTLPGTNRLRAYVITAVLGVAALVCVILTLLVVRNLQAGVPVLPDELQEVFAADVRQLRRLQCFGCDLVDRP